MTTTEPRAPSARELADAYLENAAVDHRIPHTLRCDLDFIEYHDHMMDKGLGSPNAEGLRGCECEKAFARSGK